MAPMQSFEASIVIDVPRERVYEYVSDLTRHHEWAANTIRLERDGDGFRSYGRQLRHENRNILTIVERKAPTRFAFESLGREGRFRHVFDIEGAAGKSRLTEALRGCARGAAVAGAVAPVFDRGAAEHAR